MRASSRNPSLRRDLKDGTAALAAFTGTAARKGRALQVPGCIEYQAGVRVEAVLAVVSEAVQICGAAESRALSSPSIAPKTLARSSNVFSVRGAGFAGESAT